MVADRLADVHGINIGNNAFGVAFGQGQVDDHPVILAKPMTFMNRVGPAVKDLAVSLVVDTQDILVIHDDIDIVFGKLKIKEKGGDGGHNGVKSLIVALESDVFTRIRIGIGRPEAGQEVSPYVLGNFDKDQEKHLDDVISKAQHAVEAVLIKGPSEAMNQFHGEKISVK
jgi:PTH1 family peptidyl-tRNA hydrolase